MLDRWNLTELLMYARSSYTFPFVSGKQSYTLGTGGDFSTPRPAKIEKLSVLYPGTGTATIELPLDATFNLEQWQNICVKSTPSVYPLACYIRPEFPDMVLNFWPIPSGPASVILYTWDQMPNLVNLTDIIELPQGYSDAIIYNLAVRICQMFDRVPSPQLLDEAKQGKHDINDINAGAVALHLDPMFLGNNPNNNLAAKSFGYVVL